MSLLRVQEQTIKNTLTGADDILMYELSVAGLQILLGEQPLQCLNKNVDFSANPAYPEARAGHIYIAKDAGEVGQVGGTLGTGKFVDEKSILLCIENNEGGDESEVGDKWIVIASTGSSGVTTTALSQIDQTPDIAGMTYGVISGDVNGVNDTFVVSKGNFIPGKLVVVYRGQTMFEKMQFEIVDATIGKFKFLFIPVAGSPILVMYAYKDSRAGSFDDSFDDSFD